MIGIEEACCFLPERRVPIRDLVDELKLTPNDVYLHTAFHGQRRIAFDPSIGLQSLLEASLDQLFDIQRTSEFRVTNLLYTHTISLNQDPLDPLLPKFIKRYGLDSCNAYAITQANCASGLMALEYARTILEDSADDEAVIILSGDRGFANWRHVPRCTVTGDGSSAVLVTRQSEKNVILSTNSKLDGRWHMGMADPLVQEAFHKDHDDILKDFILDTLAKGGITLDELDYILPHNVSAYSWIESIKHMGKDKSLLYLKNVPKTGHCFTADNFINLVTASEEGALNRGDSYLMASLGAGFYYSAALLRH